MSQFPEPNLRAAVALVTEMMSIPGKSGEERAITEFIRSRLIEAGIDASLIKQDSAHRKSPFGGEVGNLIVKLPRKGVRGPRRMLMAHIDTVPICVGCKPIRKGDRIVSATNTGLGGDDRAGAAVVLTAILEILRQDLPHPPLTLFWPVQEEVGLHGARNVTRSLLGNPELCFNFDGGSATKLTIGATGCYRLQIDIYGQAAHAGVAPQNGLSAITVASLAIARLHERGLLGKVEVEKGSGTSNVGIFHAGDATNVVTPYAQLFAEVRSHDAKFREWLLKQFEVEFERALKDLRLSENLKGEVKFQSRLDYESYRLSETEPAVVEAASAMKSLGLEPVYAIADGGLDANWTTAYGMPTVSMGAGQENIHTVDETLNIEEFQTACRIGLLLAAGNIQ